MDSYTRLRQLLSGYMYTRKQPDTTELQQCLQAVTSEQRYELVTEVRDWLGTAIFRAAFKGHTETISCILDSFTAEVRYKLLKVQGFSHTAIHLAAIGGRTQAMRCMLDNVSPEHQIQLLNTRVGTNQTSLDLALSRNKPEAAALIRQYIETAQKNIKEKQERKQDLNNADSQRGLKRKIVDFKEEVHRLRAKLEEQEVLNQQKDQQIEALQQKMDEITEKVCQMEQRTQEQEVGVQRAAEELAALAATTEVHGVRLQQHDEKLTTLQQQGNEMKTKMVEMKGEISQVKQQTQEQKVNVQDAADKIPVLTATTEGHGVKLQQHEENISALQQQGIEQNTQIKANTEGISKNRDDTLQQDSLFQKKPDQTAELPEDCCINPEQEVERSPTPTGEEVEEEYIDRGIQVIYN